MIYWIEGIIIMKDSDFVVLKSNNIGYQIFITQKLLQDLKLKDNLQLFVCQIFREDQVSLYGFLSLQERRIFKSIISVSGIGAKIALGILSSYNSDEFIDILVNERMDLLTSVSGIGSKTAKRIILELKNNYENNIDSKVLNQLGDQQNEFILAMESLGYDKKSINQILRDAPLKGCLSEKIKIALQYINQQKNVQ
jgi:Holliday junction DNA helicase RuvA